MTLLTGRRPGVVASTLFAALCFGGLCLAACDEPMDTEADAACQEYLSECEGATLEDGFCDLLKATQGDAEDSGCQQEFSALVSCGSELETICSMFTKCKDERDEVYGCLAAP